MIIVRPLGLVADFRVLPFFIECVGEKHHALRKNAKRCDEIHDDVGMTRTILSGGGKKKK